MRCRRRGRGQRRLHACGAITFALIFFVHACEPFASSQAPNTDADAGSSSDSTIVNVADASDAAQTIAVDTFTRVVSSGLGNAEVGGAWSVDGFTSGVANDEAFFVANHAGGAGYASLDGVDAGDVDLAVTWKAERIPEGGLYLSLHARGGGLTTYAFTVIVRSDDVNLSISRLDNGAAVDGGDPFSSASISGVDLDGGAGIRMRAQVRGQNPPTLVAKVWRSTEVEPPSWQITTVDSTTLPAMATGKVGLNAYVSQKADAASSFKVFADDFAAVSP